MEVIDIQAVKDCLAEVSDCEDKQYAIALLEWAIGKRTFDLAEHDSELLDRCLMTFKSIIRNRHGQISSETEKKLFEDIDVFIAGMKAEVSE